MDARRLHYEQGLHPSSASRGPLRVLEYSVGCRHNPDKLYAHKTVHFKDRLGFTRRGSVTLERIDVPMSRQSCSVVMRGLKRQGAHTDAEAWTRLAAKYGTKKGRRPAHEGY